MENKIKKIKLQKELINLSIEINDNKNYMILETFEELNNLLNITNKNNQTLFFYLERIKIQNILFDSDEIINVNNKNINYNGLKSLFYLSLAIKNDRNIINYSYDSVFIDDLYNRIKVEKNKLTKLLLYIIFDIFFENYKQTNNINDSISNDTIDKTTEEIKIFLNEQLPILNKYDLFLHKKEGDLIDIENIYSGILIYLIRNRQFDNYEYVNDIMKQLDFGNIELTYNIFKELKKEFDDNSEKEYIDKYKIKNFESLKIEGIINFNYLILRYVFKNSIYLYNIDFLLETRKIILNLLNNNYYKIKNLITTNLHEKNKSIDERKAFILKTFLDSEYYTSGYEIKILNEVLKYYNNFCFEDENGTKELEEIIQKGVKKNGEEYFDLYAIAKRRNIRYELLKYIFDNKTDISHTQKYFFENIVEPWENSIENLIKAKNKGLQKIVFREEIFNFFMNENNKKNVLQIFTQEVVDIYIIKYKLIIIKKYFENYLFESKKEDIEVITPTKEDKSINDFDKYLKYLPYFDKATIMNNQYKIISKLFNINNKTKTEEYVNELFKEWEAIKYMLEEKKFDIKDMEIKIKLFGFLDGEKNQKNLREILNEESFQFLLAKKEEASNEILHYYETFFPESKQKSIELIKKGKIENNDLNEYPKAKKRNLIKPIIFSLIDNKIEKNEKEISVAIEKWEKIESDIKNKQYDNIDKNDRFKIINIFKNKDNPNNNIITKIFTNDIIEAFIANENISEKQNKNEDLSLKKENSSSSSKEMRQNNRKKNLESKFNNITMLFCFNNKKLIAEKIWKNDILYQKNNFNLLEKDELKKIEEEIQKHTFKYPLIFKLIIEQIDETVLYKYEFLDFNNYSKDKNAFVPLKEEKPSTNLVSEEFKNYLSKISKQNDIKDNNNNNDKKLIEISSKILEKMENRAAYNPNNKNNHIVNQQSANNYSGQDNEIDMTKLPEKNDELSKRTDKFKVLEFLRVIGNHNDKNKMFTPEFINETNINYIMSTGSNNEINIYNKDFNEEKSMKIDAIRDWVFSIYEREKNIEKKETDFIACANKEIHILTYKDTKFANKKMEVTNMSCLSSVEVTIEEKSYLIIAGRNGVKVIVDAFKDGNKSELNEDIKNFYIVRDKTFRSVFKLSENRIALTSNEILPDGINKLIIYNFNKNNNNSKNKGIIETEKEGKYSFIASNNGMACLNENVLLCACKKYTSEYKNGILLVLLSNKCKEKHKDNCNCIEVKEKFLDTKEFEVYCFCPIWQSLKQGEQKGAKTKFSKKTDYFLVGGFDNNLREGKIKLYRYERENNNNVTDIKFLQNIEFEKDEYLMCDKTSNEIKTTKFKGLFSGAINSIIQNQSTWNILAGCYDGKIYLLSKPNLISYGVDLNY